MINLSYYIAPSVSPQKLPRNMNSSIGNTGRCHVPQNGLRLLSLISFHALLRILNRILPSAQQPLPLVQGPPLSRAELLSVIDAALALLEED
jgi:hypothetical protein